MSLLELLREHPQWLVALLAVLGYLWLRRRLMRGGRQARGRGRREQPVRSQAEGRTRAAGKRFEEEVAESLAGLGQHGYVTLANVRVEGETESEIDAVAIGPNGIFCVEAKSRSGLIRVDRTGWSYTPYATGVARRLEESPVEQNRRHLDNLRRFLATHLSEAQVGKIRFHNVICLSDQSRVEGADRAGAPVVPLGRLAAFVHSASGQNPLPRREWSRLASLLTEETARCEAAFREREARRERKGR